MTELIRQMSQIQVPDDLLRQVDLDGLINDFQKTFKRLGDFRNTRDAYEKRSGWKKLGDLITFDDTMENAQLDAVETQAAFSKAIGQLMVLSIVQSQRLQQQQEQLSTQQGVIKEQTQRIELNTIELSEQHETLAKQNADLEKLVTDFFELRGLTQEGAKKLISIANEVKATRDDLLRTVEVSLEAASTQLQQALDQVSRQTGELKGHVDRNVSVVAKRCDDVSSELQANDRKWSSQLAEFQVSSSNTQAKVASIGLEFATQNGKLDRLAIELTANLENVTREFSAYRDSISAQVRKLAAALGVLAVALAGSIAYIGSRL